ncbi:unnamed protein product [Parascedosporium putredinis]|uniref:histidine kinase n=1 Tax=Parascedosporium putredinis TaxID=1442378 RepID=A0A9P1H3W9_9PEZI|nr:unnamed protein product [Parascedosporium putredinis]CAI7995507.1 unnamed protein product [Parascedosporium putredinis]
MRVAIREQLVLLVTFTVLVSLAVVALPTWFFVHRFVINVRKDALSLTASLKASRITAELDLVRSNCRTIASRLLIQRGLKSYNDGNDTSWQEASEDLSIALSARSQTNLLQARIYTRDGSSYPVVNVTGRNNPVIELPYGDQNGNPVILGNTATQFGFPPDLYPNVTYKDLGSVNAQNNLTEFAAFAFDTVNLTHPAGLLLGPLVVNESYALMSLTLPIRDNDQLNFPIGLLTIVASAVTLVNIVNSREGLGNTGIVLVVGPDDPSNRFNKSVPQADPALMGDPELFQDVYMHYLLPANPLPNQEDRHSARTYLNGTNDNPFKLGAYPAALLSWTKRIIAVNNASSLLSTTNEDGKTVAVGFARTNTTLANWTVLVEQTKKEAYEPIVNLRKILLGCVFGTAGVIFVLTYPCAHVSVMPIRRLKAATEKTVSPPGYEDDYFSPGYGDSSAETPGSGQQSHRSQDSIKGWFWKLLIAMGYRPTPQRRRKPEESLDSSRRVFKIPGKVMDKKHLITDELTELTTTFNDMSDELVKQYTLLDAKVAARTRELEVSKKAAEAANESKTLFIANISHELKTPLNGILGMCAVCMEEDDLTKIQQSLRTLYKSGDLLLHLLEDLLSFSKNQIGQQLSLEQREFRLAEIRSQILTIFDKQVRESHINFSVTFLGADHFDLEKGVADYRFPALGPQGTGKLKNMCLWGDQHRILQILINLVSNSLKFTPQGGKVELRIKCLGEMDEGPTGAPGASRSSSTSKSSGPASRGRARLASTSTRSGSSRGQSSSIPPDQIKGTALSINPMDPKQAQPVYIRGRSPTPPPLNAKTYLFEFEVEDTGPGIREEMQQRVFEPFMQGDLGLSKKFGGTGLGLSICQQLATIMGGNITLESTIGVGSTFTVRIPLKYVRDRPSSTASSSAKSRSTSVDGTDTESPRNSMAKTNNDNKSAPVLDTQPSALADKEKSGGGKLRVLVADDNSTNIEVVSKMLKLEDVYDVTIAKDGQEAFDRVKDAMADERPFDVIFMDVQMPNLDGLQSTRKIREMGYKSPIVALTAFSEESNVKECMESGMDEFLSKPIRRPALKQVLRKFATIPEEPETTVTTPDELPNGPDGSVTVGGSSPANGVVNEKESF